jgi:pyruvate dehydrogenase E1 component alpha subunit
MSDAQHYRTKDEVAEYQLIDPILTAKDMLLKKKWATGSEIEAIDARVKELVAECVDFAEKSPYPDAEELWQHVYVDGDYPFITE